MIKTNYEKANEKLFIAEKIVNNQCKCSNCICKCVSQFSNADEIYSDKNQAK